MNFDLLMNFLITTGLEVYLLRAFFLLSFLFLIMLVLIFVMDSNNSQLNEHFDSKLSTVNSELVEVNKILLEVKELLLTMQKVKPNTGVQESIYTTLETFIKKAFSIYYSPELVSVILPTAVFGIVAFTSTFLLFRYILQQEHIRTTKNILDANLFNANALRECINADSEGTRKIITSVVSDVSSLSKQIVQHNTNVHEESTITLINVMDSHVKSISSMCTDQNLVLAENNEQIFEHLVRVRSKLNIVIGNQDLLLLKLDNLTDAIALLSETEQQLNLATILGGIV